MITGRVGTGHLNVHFGHATPFQRWTLPVCSPDCALNDLCPGPFPSRHQTRAPGFIPVGGRVELGLLGPALISGLQREVLRTSEVKLVCTLETRPPFVLFFPNCSVISHRAFSSPHSPRGVCMGDAQGRRCPGQDTKMSGP